MRNTSLYASRFRAGQPKTVLLRRFPASQTADVEQELVPLRWPFLLPRVHPPNFKCERFNASI